MVICSEGTGLQAGANTEASWLRRLGGYCWRFRRELLFAFVGIVIGSVVAGLAPLNIRKIVDEVILERREPLGPWLAFLAGAGLLRFLASMLRRYHVGRVHLGVEYALRIDIFEALQRLDGSQQHKLRTGQVVSRSISDMATVERALQLGQVTGNILTFVISLVVMLRLSLALTAVTLVILPLLFLVAKRSTKVLSPCFWDYSHRAGELAGVIEAAVTGVHVVQDLDQQVFRMSAVAHLETPITARRARLPSNACPGPAAENVHWNRAH